MFVDTHSKFGCLIGLGMIVVVLCTQLLQSRLEIMMSLLAATDINICNVTIFGG